MLMKVKKKLKGQHLSKRITTKKLDTNLVAKIGKLRHRRASDLVNERRGARCYSRGSHG